MQLAFWDRLSQPDNQGTLPVPLSPRVSCHPVLLAPPQSCLGPFFILLLENGNGVGGECSLETQVSFPLTLVQLYHWPPNCSLFPTSYFLLLYLSPTPVLLLLNVQDIQRFPRFLKKKLLSELSKVVGHKANIQESKNQLYFFFLKKILFIYF